MAAEPCSIPQGSNHPAFFPHHKHQLELTKKDAELLKNGLFLTLIHVGIAITDSINCIQLDPKAAFLPSKFLWRSNANATNAIFIPCLDLMNEKD